MYFDHPAVVFGDEPRGALTAFVDQALRLANLRIALAGYEPLQMPGGRFESRFDADDANAPGLMVEFLTDLRRADVSNLIEGAARSMGRTISPERVQEWTDEALQGLGSVNGRYDSAVRSQIVTRLQPRLRQLRDGGGAP